MTFLLTSSNRILSVHDSDMEYKSFNKSINQSRIEWKYYKNNMYFTVIFQ